MDCVPTALAMDSMESRLFVGTDTHMIAVVMTNGLILVRFYFHTFSLLFLVEQQRTSFNKTE
jgi:hypothetical protein